MTPYVEVQSIAISDGRRLFAAHVAFLAADDLRIPVPEVRWFRRAPAPQGWPLRTWHDERILDGEAHSERPGEIWVVDGLSRRSLADVVAHETHHAAWYRRYGPGWYSETETRAMESAAMAYAAAFVKDWRF